MFRKILLPIDVAEPEIAKEAIEAATALAKAFDSQLRLIHVTSPVVVASPMAVIPQAVYDELGVYEKSELQRLAAPLDLPKSAISAVVRIGAVYPELLSEAEEWGADLIIVGAHKRSMATYLLGSSAAAIVRHAACTVMVVRSGKKATLL
ncbi:MAG: universal stress protein [Roseiarcus sp.]|jgi:nucleotide-binding universal stress UspA family protein|uniref:universal stress protein n=1 Tax=Roseiarcus sp. TaxID=1969460 RepID=UPI003C1E8EF3